MFIISKYDCSMLFLMALNNGFKGSGILFDNDDI